MAAGGNRALVLGGGGVVGIAWDTGVLAGLREAGADVSNADLFVGTSAGSTVGAHVASGRDLDELLALQLGPSDGRMEALSAARCRRCFLRSSSLAANGDPAPMYRGKSSD